jgi:uncharacterized delta-60 repeat protein
MTLDGTSIVVAGFGGSQSMVVARFTANGILGGAVVCYAPHLIDYSARAVAVRPNGSVVLVGYARDRHPAFAVPAGPAVMYGQRAVVTIPATGTSAAACGTYEEAGGLSRGSTGVTIDGLARDGTVLDATLGGRYYEGVAALTDNRYVVASTNGVLDGSAWVQRYTAAGVGALDPTFNALGLVPGRVAVPAVNFHAIKLAADGSAFVAGETMDAASAANRLMAVAKLDVNGAFAAFGTGGIARTRVAGGNNTGQALALQGTNIIVGGSANLAGRAAFGLARFTATGARDNTFGTAGQTVTPFGSPSVNGYITGMAVNGNFLAVSGRLTDPSGLATVAARYFHTGAPVPPPPAPAASTQTVDSITTNSARVNGMVNTNGTASTWWVEYGTTTAYGSLTPAQPLASSNDDVDVQASLTALAAGTTYHARIVVSNATGMDLGDDVAFTTLGIASPTTGGTTGGTTTTTTTTTTGGTTATTVKKAKKRSCIVPKVVGKKLNKARTTVYARGCKVQVRYVQSKKVKNTVLAQSRKAGKKLSFRAVVRLTVATKAIS